MSSKKRCLQAWGHLFLFHIHLLCLIYTLIVLYILYLYEQQKYSYSTAVGLFNTVINIVLLIIVNKIVSKASDVEFV